jgi:hypothetical protein
MTLVDLHRVARKGGESMSLSLDLTPLWDSINTYFPVFFAVLAIGGGISIALRLGEFLINKIHMAFR